jgi:nucleoside-diphosphate-sugar epimerase
VKKLSLPHPKHIRRRLNREVTIRIIADVLMLNGVLIIALVLRYLWLIGVEGVVDTAQYELRCYIQAYFTSCWMLTLISLVIFHFSGFYSHSRFYAGRYKALVIAQAVSLSYLIFSFLMLLTWDIIMFPRSALIVGWVLTLIVVISARLWFSPWIAALNKEPPFSPTPQPAHDRITNVLVIGGAGYIGSALLPKLLANGYNVRTLDLLLYGIEPIESVMTHPHLKVIQGDFLQMDEVVRAMRDVDAVIHLGAIVGDPACKLCTGLTIEENLIATRMIAEVACCMNVNRMIFASTCSVYGASDEVLDERSSLKPVSLYASSKVASEKVLLSMEDPAFAPIILRFGTVYGLSGRTRFDLVINLLTAKAVIERQITVFGGDQWRPFVHVDDVALAVLTVLEAPLPLVRGQIFNVGSNEQNYTIRQVAEIIQSIIPEAEIVDVEGGSDPRNYCVNFNKIQKTLGFTPQWTVERGVQQVLDAIMSGQIENYQLPEYSNVKYLREQGITRLSTPQRHWTYDLLNETVSLPDEPRL